MKTQIIPYGTTHKVRIEYSTKTIIMAVGQEIKEGFVLMHHGLKELPEINDTGKIVFEKGGPNNGHWQFYPETIKGIQKVQGPHDFPSNSKIID